MLIGRTPLSTISLPAATNMPGTTDTNDSNEPSPSLKSSLTATTGYRKIPRNAHLSFLYTANTLGMNGAEASPLYTLVAFPPNPANGAKVEVIVLVWNALCPLSDKWKPFSMKATPAGLEYTASICVEASRANILKNNTC